MEVPVINPEPAGKGRPRLCGALWGAGIGLLISSSCLVLSRDVYATLLILIAAPFVVAICIVGGMLVYGRTTQKKDWLAAKKYQLVAASAMFILAALPWGAQTIQLYYTAYYEIPTYPASDRLGTVLHRGPGPKLNIRFRTPAKKAEVLQFYDAELRKRGWFTYSDPTFSVSATKPGYALFVYYSEGEIRMDWYRSYQTH